MTLRSLTAQDIIGDWELVSFEQLGPDGQVLKSDSASKGLLIYTASGAMSVSMYREVMTDDEDLKRNFVRDLYYAGTYEIEGDVILHHSKIALHAQHRDQSLPRRARLEDSGRVLILEALSIEAKVLGNIRWRRK